MGCASSAPQVKKEAGAGGQATGLTHALTQQMTIGERQDFKLQHNKYIEGKMAEAKQWLKDNQSRWIWDYYTDETRLLGRGAFARVFMGRVKATRELVAIKIISKDNKFYDQQHRAMVTKAACMRELQGHRSMVKLYEIFNAPEGFYVVLEFMPAIPLFDAIVEKGHFSEADAAVVMRQLLQFVQFMHESNIVHRDIKPENLLLLKPRKATVLAAGGNVDDPVDSDDDEDTKANKRKCLTAEEEGLVDEDMWADVPDGLRLKVIDYGTCNFCEAGQHLHSKIGTARYVAPEVLARDYDKSSDIWSAGVVLYILLCGRAPFKGSTDTGTLAKVKLGQYSVDGPDWEHVSESAKDLLSHMLVVDPEQRWTAEELLEHMWFQEAPQMSTNKATQQNGYLARLTGFAGYSRMKRLALKLMANQEDTLTMKEVERLRELFRNLDEDGDGLIDGRALHRGLAAVGCELPEDDVREFLAVSQADTHTAAGVIDINEFIAALFNSDKVVTLKPRMIEEEFARLDVDQDGLITAADLVASSKEGGGIAELLARGTSPMTVEEAEEILEELLGPGEAGSSGEAGGKRGVNLETFRSMMSSSSTAKRAAQFKQQQSSKLTTPKASVAAAAAADANGFGSPHAAANGV